MITKQALLQATKVETVKVKGLAEPVRIKASKYHEVKKWLDDESGDEEAIAASLIDEEGKPLLTVEEARQLDTSLFQELVQALLKVNGFDSAPKG